MNRILNIRRSPAAAPMPTSTPTCRRATRLPLITKLSPNVPSIAPYARASAEAQRLTEALRRHGNNRTFAAAELGISRVTLYKKLHRYGLM